MHPTAVEPPPPFARPGPPNTIPPPLCQGDGAASSKSGRKAVKERLGELKAAPPVSRDYTVRFAFEAAARKLNPPLITMDKVEFSFGTSGRPLFKALDFDLSMDSRVALVGPNGCGKSTFMQLLEGSLTPTGGTVDQANGRLRVGRCVRGGGGEAAGWQAAERG